MSDDILLQLVRSGFGGDSTLIATDTYAHEVLDGMPNMEIVRCEISRPRNRRHHNLAMGLLRIVFENQMEYATLETMLDHIKIIIGHYDAYTLKDGTKVAKLRSIAWHEMDQAEFEEWWDKFLVVILDSILPGTKRPDLEQRVYEMLGEITPKDATR